MSLVYLKIIKENYRWESINRVSCKPAASSDDDNTPKPFRLQGKKSNTCSLSISNRYQQHSTAEQTNWGSIPELAPLTSIVKEYIDGSVQDCSISIANAMEILQSCTKPLIYPHAQHNIYGKFHILMKLDKMSSAHVHHFNDLVQDCSISIAKTMEIPQSCPKPSTLSRPRYKQGEHNTVECKIWSDYNSPRQHFSKTG